LRRRRCCPLVHYGQLNGTGRRRSRPPPHRRESGIPAGSTVYQPGIGGALKLVNHRSYCATTACSRALAGAVTRSACPGPDRAQSPSAATGGFDHAQQPAEIQSMRAFASPRSRYRRAPPAPPRLEGGRKGPDAAADAARALPGNALRRRREEELEERSPAPAARVSPRVAHGSDR
jgi:hypothetical protein